MKNGFKIIDSDMHIMEPLDLWERYIDSRFKERAPRAVRVPTRGDLNPATGQRQRTAPK